MSSQRKAVRTALVSALVAANTAAAARVYASRVVEWDRVELPAVGVYFEREAVEVFEEAPRRYLHTAELRIECVAQLASAGGPNSKKVPQQLEDALDDLGDQVLQVLFRDPEIAETCRDARLVGGEVAVRKDGALHIGAFIQRWEVEFFTEAPAPVPELDDLEGVGVRWDLAPPDEVIEAEDSILIEQEA